MFTKIIIIIKGTKVGIALQMDTYEVSTVMIRRNLVSQIQDNSLFFLKAEVNQESTFYPLPKLLLFLFPSDLKYFPFLNVTAMNI